MFLKTKGEYNCSSCKCISNVVISRGAYALASAVCIAALLIVVLYSIGGDHGSFMGMACVFAPFLIFYIMIPFFVKLIPCKDKSAVNKLLDMRRSDLPNEMAFQSASPQTEAKPVMLDVDEDFSVKFMKAKNNLHKNNVEAEEGAAVSGEIEDIHNTMLSFEIDKDTDENNNISEEDNGVQSEENNYELIEEKPAEEEKSPADNVLSEDKSEE